LQYLIPAAVALMVTVLLALSMPFLRNTHTLDIRETEYCAPDDYLYYRDLDSDGTSEMLRLYYNNAGNLSLRIGTIEGSTFNQFNFPGRLTRLGPMLDFRDINADGVSDVFVCTEKNDSLFLTIVDDIMGHPTTTREFFLDPVNRYNDHGDYEFIPGGLADLNLDGESEYILAVNGGYALQPRRVYAIDYLSGEVTRSPLSGAAIVSLDLFDLDGDQAPEILLNTVAPENFKSRFPYRDSVSWLMVLDSDLGFYRKPLACHAPPSWISMEPYLHEGTPFVFVYYQYLDGQSYRTEIAIYNDTLGKVRSTEYPRRSLHKYHLWRIPGNTGIQSVRLSDNTGIYSVDFNLEDADSVVNGVPFWYLAEGMMDADGDGSTEFFLYNDYEIHIFNEDLDLTARAEARREEHSKKVAISLMTGRGNHPEILMQIGRERFYMKYAVNRLHAFRWLFYLLVFASSFGMLYLLTLAQYRILQKRFERERLINRLQLQTIRNQLDPHFTFNALNAVGSLIYKGERDRAYKYLKGLSDILRMVAADPGQMSWSLEDELAFVREYLEIEKLRFREKFRYHLEAEEGLGKRDVPKLSILGFVENAVKHGLRHKAEDRSLEVEASLTGEGMEIVITDNGIGRKAAAAMSDGEKGQGIAMMQEYFTQFGETTGQHAGFCIEDLYNESTEQRGIRIPAGTRVIITIQ